jgi:hypothetical protein
LFPYISGDKVVTRRVHIGHMLLIGLVLSFIWSLDALPFAQAQDSPVADAGGTYSGFEGEVKTAHPGLEFAPNTPIPKKAPTPSH